MTNPTSPRPAPLPITPRPDCRECFGTGIVYDIVDYGSTTIRMPSTCACVEEQVPDGYEGEIRIVGAAET